MRKPISIQIDFDNEWKNKRDYKDITYDPYFKFINAEIVSYEIIEGWHYVFSFYLLGLGISLLIYTNKRWL